MKWQCKLSILEFDACRARTVKKKSAKNQKAKKSPFISRFVLNQIENYWNALFFKTIFRCAVSDIPYSIGVSVSQEELNTFVNALLQKKRRCEDIQTNRFWIYCLEWFLEITFEWSLARAISLVRRCYSQCLNHKIVCCKSSFMDSNDRQNWHICFSFTIPNGHDLGMEHRNQCRGLDLCVQMTWTWRWFTCNQSIDEIACIR